MDDDPSNTTAPPISTAPANTTSAPLPGGANLPYPFLIVAGVFSLIAILSSIWLIYKHLRNYTEPRYQKPIIRILFMVPIYAINSWLGLLVWEYSIYFDIPRDCYEAYALYQFFTLLVALLDGEQKLIPILEEKPRIPWFWPFCCFSFKPGMEFYYTCRLLVLQFVLLKPLISILSLVLEVLGYYGDGSFSPFKGYLYLTILDNISITFSLTWLVLFYMATREELEQFHPVPKFLAVKLVIFASFWQGVLIAILSALGIIHDVGQLKTVNISAALQDFIICIEMAVIAVWHHWVFPFEVFRDPTKIPFLKDIRRNAKPLLRNFTDVLNQGDILLETQKTFHPKEIKQLITAGGRARSVPPSPTTPLAFGTDPDAEPSFNSPTNPRDSDRAPLLANAAERGEAADTKSREFEVLQDK